MQSARPVAQAALTKYKKKTVPCQVLRNSFEKVDEQVVRFILIPTRFLEKLSLLCIRERASARRRRQKWANTAVQRAKTIVPPFSPSCVKRLDEGQDIQRSLGCGFWFPRQGAREVDSRSFCSSCRHVKNEFLSNIHFTLAFKSFYRLGGGGLS